MIDLQVISSELQQLGFKKSEENRNLFIYGACSVYPSTDSIYMLHGTSISRGNYRILLRIDDGEIEGRDMNEFRRTLYRTLGSYISINGKVIGQKHEK